jgi:hypothetical protein
MDVLQFGVFIDDELFGLVCGVYMSVVPQWGKSFVVIAVKMCEEVVEGAFGERFAEVEIVYDNICICNYARHSIYYQCFISSKKRGMYLEKVTIMTIWISFLDKTHLRHLFV